MFVAEGNSDEGRHTMWPLPRDAAYKAFSGTISSGGFVFSLQIIAAAATSNGALFYLQLCHSLLRTSKCRSSFTASLEDGDSPAMNPEVAAEAAQSQVNTKHFHAHRTSMHTALSASCIACVLLGIFQIT